MGTKEALWGKVERLANASADAEVAAERARIRQRLDEFLARWAAGHPESLRQVLVRELVPELDRIFSPEGGAAAIEARGRA